MSWVPGFVRGVLALLHWGVQWAFPFNTPVDLEQWKDYTEKVERPMDFGTIKQNLETNVYSTPKEFDTDVQQVFINVRLYNQPDSDVCKMAAAVKV